MDQLISGFGKAVWVSDDDGKMRYTCIDPEEFFPEESEKSPVGFSSFLIAEEDFRVLV